MAKTIAKCIGIDGSGREKVASRLGHKASEGQANTWHTFTACHVNADGSGFVKVTRDGATIHEHRFGAE